MKKERFSFWFDFEDKMKLESIAKVDDLKIGYLIRKAIKEYIKENYAKAMVEITAREYQEKLIEADRKNKTKPLTKSQQKILRVGVKERQKIRRQKEQRMRERYYK